MEFLIKVENGTFIGVVVENIVMNYMSDLAIVVYTKMPQYPTGLANLQDYLRKQSFEFMDTTLAYTGVLCGTSSGQKGILCNYNDPASEKSLYKATTILMTILDRAIREYMNNLPVILANGTYTACVLHHDKVGISGWRTSIERK